VTAARMIYIGRGLYTQSAIECSYYCR